MPHFPLSIDQEKEIDKKGKTSQQPKRNQNQNNNETTTKQNKFKDLIFRVIIRYWSDQELGEEIALIQLKKTLQVGNG